MDIPPIFTVGYNTPAFRNIKRFSVKKAWIADVPVFD
jgi:hypothetical protein